MDNKNSKFDLNLDGMRLDEDDFVLKEKTEEVSTAPKKPASKEEMAKMIAKNMASSDSSFEDLSYIDDPVIPEKKFSTQTAVKTDEKPISSKTSTAKAKSKGKKKKKKKKSAGKKVTIALCSVLGLAIVAGGVLYIAGMNAYKGVFLDNTYINGINVSGKTQAQAAELVSSESVIPEKVLVTKPDGTNLVIKMSDIGYADQTQTVVSQYYSQQNHYAWFNSKFKNTEYNFTNTFKYDKSSLEKILEKKIANDTSGKAPTDAYISKNDGGEGYVVVKETNGNKIDPAKADTLYKFVEDALDDDIFEIDVSQADCYEKAEITADMLKDSCDRLNSLYDIEITFDFDYTTEVLTGDTVMDWITFETDDPDEGYTVDEDKVMAYVETLADKYDTFGKDRTFKTTNRGTITMEEGEGCYGWWIDQEKTRDMIVELIEDGDSASTDPIYYVNPNSQYTYTCNEEWRTADSDYGDTYIEVDLSAQHLWYYENGKLKMESDIVSGYTSESRNTPAGVYKLWYKEKGKTLKGSSDGVSYASYVDYWNYVSTIGIGLHDASWQNGVFGGTKYQTSTWGSHGCINMPFDKAKYVYENIDTNTPVFMYWS